MSYPSRLVAVCFASALSLGYFLKPALAQSGGDALLDADGQADLLDLIEAGRQARLNPVYDARQLKSPAYAADLRLAERTLVDIEAPVQTKVANKLAEMGAISPGLAWA